METKNISDFTDAELARMVRESIYLQRTTFGESDRHARFLLVLAVPYGQDDFPETAEPITLADALDAYARLLQDDDWQDRSFQVYDHAAPQHFYTATREECEPTPSAEEAGIGHMSPEQQEAWWDGK